MLVFLGCRTSIARYVAKWGIALMCLCKRRHQGGGIAPCWGIAGMAEKASRDRGYRSNTIAISRDMGPRSVAAVLLSESGTQTHMQKAAFSLREAEPGGFQTGGFPIFFWDKVRIVSRTLSGLFLVGAVNRPRKRNRTNRENPRTIPGHSSESRKNRESPKKDQKGQIGTDESSFYM